MSEDVAPISREEQVLAEQMELELAAARHVQAKLLAAEDPDEINGLGRTWQRVSRSLRQTVALKAKLTRERETAAAERPPRTPAGPTPATDTRRRARIEAAADEVREFVERERLDWDEADDFATHEILIELSQDESFLHMPMEEVVAHVMRRLGFTPCDDELPEAKPQPQPDPADPATPPVQDSA